MPNSARPLTIAAGLVLGYYGLLLIFDQWVFAAPPLPVSYYALNGGVALGILGLTLWPRATARLGRALLPGAIVVLALTPILSVYGLVPPALYEARPLGLILSSEGLVLRIVPILLVGLTLTAGYYREPQIVAYTLGTSAVRVGALFLFNPAPGRTASGELLFILGVLGVETISFLIIGLAISIPIRRMRTQQRALDAANRQLRQYADTLESLAVSRERNRLARELHDTLAHTLGGLSVELATVDAYWEIDPATARQMLREAQDTARLGLRETRQALRALRANPLEDLGLEIALRQLAETAAARAHLHLDLTLPTPLPVLAPHLEQGLYRVAQEALANVVYHARAHCLTVALTCQPGTTRLVIRDDGVGFDPNHPVTAGHFGLAGIHERAHLLGGHLTLTSQPGGGTTIDLLIAEGETRT
jgi:signal transduction histidine kinase